MTEKELIRTALEARKNAYTPYSHWAVGAALEAADGTVYRGCNIENASYTPTNCAERTAFFTAVCDGQRKFRRIAVAGGKEGQDPVRFQYSAPCGVCRQVMMEFCDPETFEIIMAVSPEEYKVFTLKELLPVGFGPSSMD